jgi:hypothetical protein
MTSPFDFLNSINTSKKNLIAEDPGLEKDYKPFLMNRGLSYFQDTIMYANQMNICRDLDPKLQYDFLISTIRPRKRFSKWFKKEDDSDVEAVKEYYGYSNSQAVQAISILSSDQIKIIKTSLEKGG